MKKFLFPILCLFLYTGVGAQIIGDVSRIGLFINGGLPVRSQQNDAIKVLINQSYIVGYDEELKDPIWVAFRLGNYKGAAKGEAAFERSERFFTDLRTTSKVKHDDYNSAGYDRGHMAPNATMLAQYGQIGQTESFLMSNIIPQKAIVNQKIWAAIEDLERTKLSQSDSTNKEVHDLYVITGPVFSANPQRLASGVAIPASSYRIIAYRKGYLGTFKACAYLVPQEATDFTNLRKYYTTIDKIEELTGLDFFPEFTETVQHNLENKKRDCYLNDLP